MFLLLSAGTAFQKERTQPKTENLHLYMLQYNEGPSPTSKPVSQINETALHSVASCRENTEDILRAAVHKSCALVTLATNFGRWSLICVGPPYETCFMTPFRHL